MVICSFSGCDYRHKRFDLESCVMVPHGLRSKYTQRDCGVRPLFVEDIFGKYKP